MRSSLRLAAVVLGLAAALYGTASLTGGWLGTPPWRERETSSRDHAHAGSGQQDGGWHSRGGLAPYEAAIEGLYDHADPRPGREWISGGVVSAGLALAALGARTRRRSAAS